MNKLREAEVVIASGSAVAVASRRIGVSDQTSTADGAITVPPSRLGPALGARPTPAAMFPAEGTPEEIEAQIDCARQVLAIVNAELMVSLMRDEETPGERSSFRHSGTAFSTRTGTLTAGTSETTTQTSFRMPRS